MTAPASPVPFEVIPEPGSPLAAWVAARPAAAAARDEGKRAFDQVKAEIEAGAAAQAAAANKGVLPGRIRIAGVPGAPDLRMTWHGNEVKFDRAKFEADYPGVYERYLVPAKPYWETREA